MVDGFTRLYCCSCNLACLVRKSTTGGKTPSTYNPNIHKFTMHNNWLLIPKWWNNISTYSICVKFEVNYAWSFINPSYLSLGKNTKHVTHTGLNSKKLLAIFVDLVDWRNQLTRNLDGQVGANRILLWSWGVWSVHGYSFEPIGNRYILQGYIFSWIFTQISKLLLQRSTYYHLCPVMSVHSMLNSTVDSPLGPALCCSISISISAMWCSGFFRRWHKLLLFTTLDLAAMQLAKQYALFLSLHIVCTSKR